MSSIYLNWFLTIKICRTDVSIKYTVLIWLTLRPPVPHHNFSCPESYRPAANGLHLVGFGR